MVDEKRSQLFISSSNWLLGPLSQMAMLLIKMAMQCLDFCHYSPSQLVIASIYASTAFIKHSKQFSSNDTIDFTYQVRQIIFECIEQDKQTLIDNVAKETRRAPGGDNYLNQFNPAYVEQVAMYLVDFYKMFDTWHCGLNQLKKFHPTPFE